MYELSFTATPSSVAFVFKKKNKDKQWAAKFETYAQMCNYYMPT